MQTATKRVFPLFVFCNMMHNGPFGRCAFDIRRFWRQLVDLHAGIPAHPDGATVWDLKGGDLTESGRPYCLPGLQAKSKEAAVSRALFIPRWANAFAGRYTHEPFFTSCRLIQSDEQWALPSTLTNRLILSWNICTILLCCFHICLKRRIVLPAFKQIPTDGTWCIVIAWIMYAEQLSWPLYFFGSLDQVTALCRQQRSPQAIYGQICLGSTHGLISDPLHLNLPPCSCKD